MRAPSSHTGNHHSTRARINIPRSILTPFSVGNLDWLYSNVTADATYQFVGPDFEIEDELIDVEKTFEMRGMRHDTGMNPPLLQTLLTNKLVTNWGIG